MNLVLTRDGSHTIYVPELNEHYHSIYGAITESEHIFINNGLEALQNINTINILEIGFGTGLNVLMTFIFSLKTELKIHYYALEKFPVSMGIVKQLNYPSLLSADINIQEKFLEIHSSPWNMIYEINSDFWLYKIQGCMEDFHPSFNYDLVYFDAFAPDKQPAVWNQRIFNTLYNNLNAGGMLTTYCVKGEVKKMLINAGFRIEKLPGPPGKREMLRGIKTP